MMRFNFFTLLIKLGMFGNYAVENDGAGASVADGEIEDNATVQANDNDKFNIEIEDKTTAIEKRLAEAEEKLAIAESQKLLQEEIQKLSKKHDGFDAKKVKEKLEEIGKTDASKADELNNPLGWELLWVTEINKNKVENDDPSFGRNIDPVEKSDAVIQRVKDGGVVTFEDKKDVLGKYF